MTQYSSMEEDLTEKDLTLSGLKASRLECFCWASTTLILILIQ